MWLCFCTKLYDLSAKCDFFMKCDFSVKCDFLAVRCRALFNVWFFRNRWFLSGPCIIVRTPGCYAPQNNSFWKPKVSAGVGGATKPGGGAANVRRVIGSIRGHDLSIPVSNREATVIDLASVSKSENGFRTLIPGVVAIRGIHMNYSPLVSEPTKNKGGIVHNFPNPKIFRLRRAIR